jgi:hypothetical protein
MDFTPRLSLPYIAAQQAQKQVTYNEAMQALDALVQPAVLSRTTAAPPGTPAEGDAYLVPAGATGTWAGHAEAMAVFRDGAWVFIVPAAGWLSYVADALEIVIFKAGSWVPLVSTGGTSIAMFGVNATPDPTNRLAVASEAVLLSHDGGSHRLKINKASTADTGTALFQVGTSGRAELGLAGDDDLHVKVSPDGTSWTEALVVAAASGLVTLPRGQLGFPATQNPSSSPNVLDDYEEGTWTPAWTASGTAPALGNGTLTGKYTKIGRQVTAVLVFAAGSTTTFGTGSWSFSLPFAPGNAAEVCGTVKALDAGNTYYAGAAFVFSGSTLSFVGNSAGSTYGNGAPFAWGVGDSFVASVTYFV